MLDNEASSKTDNTPDISEEESGLLTPSEKTAGDTAAATPASQEIQVNETLPDISTDEDFFMSAPIREKDIADEEIRKFIDKAEKEESKPIVPAAPQKAPEKAAAPKKPAVKRKKKKATDINSLLSMIDESEKKL